MITFCLPHSFHGRVPGPWGGATPGGLEGTLMPGASRVHACQPRHRPRPHSLSSHYYYLHLMMREMEVPRASGLDLGHSERRQDLNPSSLFHGPESACKVLLVVTDDRASIQCCELQALASCSCRNQYPLGMLDRWNRSSSYSGLNK